MTVTVDRIRSFNRGWTEVLGLLDQGLLETEYTLAEARVIFELAQDDPWDRLDLKNRLRIDPSFLTRVLKRLEDAGLVTSTPSSTDGRALIVSLTRAGREAFSMLNRRSHDQIETLLAPLSAEERATLVESLTVIESLVGRGDRERVIELRGLRPGDMGWVVQRHGAIYRDEYGWDSDFEALVARIVADYHHHFRPGRESAWIAEVDGARAGCVFCCHRDETTAQLRILLVEPWARGLGLGTRLVEECVGFARSAGYSKMVLWTNDVLESARRIYEAVGFVLVEEEDHHSFGHDLVGQNWELLL
ncbi:MAG TPA: bifunctional helix-turn-helix transcriptional regulator/GNAT family N-acetyltransferase [Acidimicrobiia bacterium]|nr:bifunctional helix-turn-helix transcriptional regulator/GNAT family N-acetyltransferase [Acidimicrobiia bacterium]